MSDLPSLEMSAELQAVRQDQEWRSDGAKPVLDWDGAHVQFRRQNLQNLFCFELLFIFGNCSPHLPRGRIFRTFEMVLSVLRPKKPVLDWDCTEPSQFFFFWVCLMFFGCNLKCWICGPESSSTCAKLPTRQPEAQAQPSNSMDKWGPTRPAHDSTARRLRVWRVHLPPRPSLRLLPHFAFRPRRTAT